MVNNTKDKKITFFLPRLHNNIRPLIDSFLSLDYDVSVLVLRQGKIENHAGINYLKLKKTMFSASKYLDPNGIKKFEFPSLRQVNNFFKNTKPNYLIIRNDSSLAYIPILILGKYYRCKILMYNQYPQKNPTFSQFLYNSFFYQFFKIRTITPVINKTFNSQIFLQQETIEQYRIRLATALKYDKTKSLPIWVPFMCSKKLIRITPNKTEVIRIATIGKIQSRKNLDKVILYLNNFSKLKNIVIELFVIGELLESEPNYLNYLEQIKYSVSGKIKVNILINLNRKKIDEIYEQSSIFILLSEKEIASVSQVEAFMAGCKMIIFFENGNLDFLPFNSAYQIIRTLSEFDKSLEKVLSVPVSKSNLLIYSSIYDEMCGGLEGAKRVLDLF